MNNANVRINVTGKILNGDNLGWYVVVQEDFENTGGYLVLVSPDQNFLSNNGCDYWVEKYGDLVDFFSESHWQIRWLDNGHVNLKNDKLTR